MATITLTLHGDTREVPVFPIPADHPLAEIGELGGVITGEVFRDGWGDVCDLTFWPYIEGMTVDAPVTASDGRRFGLGPVFEPGFIPVHEGNIVGWADNCALCGHHLPAGQGGLYGECDYCRF
jgi:hypothetical protein